jgi:hypothetical protein
LIKTYFPGIKYSSFLILNSYSNIIGAQLQQRSFDHLDSTEIKQVTGILIVLKHLNLYFHSMQPNFVFWGLEI